jgi:hypothetical protein
MATDKRDLWVGWTRQIALTGTVEDMVELSTRYADTMLKAFEQRFEGNWRRKTKVEPGEGDED